MVETPPHGASHRLREDMEPEIDDDALLVAAAERVSEPAARQRVSRGLAALRARLRSQEP
jgi:hypothetical protein